MKKTRSLSSSSKKSASKAGRSTQNKSATPTRSSASKKSSGSSKAASTKKTSSSTKSSTAKPVAAKKAAPKKVASKSTSKATARGGKEKTTREGLMDVMKDLLKDIFYAEKQIVKGLKKISKAASHDQLKQAFDKHREQTEGQIALLEKAFESLGMRAAGKKCPAMDGLIEEGNEHVEEMEKGAALDAALIVGAQKIEHYEIAAYGSMCTFASDLGLSECENIFRQILQQESETDELLTQVAQTVNRDALAVDEEQQ